MKLNETENWGNYDLSEALESLFGQSEQLRSTPVKWYWFEDDAEQSPTVTPQQKDPKS
jgi:hypothetical protein